MEDRRPRLVNTHRPLSHSGFTIKPSRNQGFSAGFKAGECTEGPENGSKSIRTSNEFPSHRRKEPYVCRNINPTSRRYCAQRVANVLRTGNGITTYYVRTTSHSLALHTLRSSLLDISYHTRSAFWSSWFELPTHGPSAHCATVYSHVLIGQSTSNVGIRWFMKPVHYGLVRLSSIIQAASFQFHPKRNS